VTIELKKDIIQPLTLFFIFLSIIFPHAAYASAGQASHPKLSQQEKLTPCSQCHKEATPEIYKEWYNSVHGIANVKCFQCHGTYENLRTEPDETHCAACHNKQYLKRPKDKRCWACHPAHNFFVHK